MTSKTDGERIHHSEVSLRTWELIRKELTGAPAVIREITEHIAQNMGKGIRTALLAACAMDTDESVTPVAVNASASIELLHLATLVHDDIVDDARCAAAWLRFKAGSARRKLCFAATGWYAKRFGQAVSVDYNASDLAGSRAEVFSLRVSL
jgi:hypothetical protein